MTSRPSARGACLWRPRCRPQEGAVGRRSGFTLIELMVALTLAAVISVGIMFISTTARETYTSTVQKVEVYNSFRLAMHSVRVDFEAWKPTMELEPYTDGRGGSGGARRNFHWEPGEEIRDVTDELGPGVIDGGEYGEYDEFAYILQRRYTSVEPAQLEEGDETERLHDAYQAYFRSWVYVDGQPRDANVEYMLVDASQPQNEWVNGVPPPPTRVDPDSVTSLSLYKIVRYYDVNPDTIQKLNQYPVKRRVVEVATNVTDFKIEYLVHDPFARQSVGAAKFRTPEQEYRNPPEEDIRPERISVPGGYAYCKRFGYGSVKLGVQYERATAFSARWGDTGIRPLPGHEPVRFGFRRNPKISFAELVPGDTIYIFTQGQRGGPVAAGAGASASNLVRFPAGDYTVKTNLQGMLEFEEDVDSSTWDGLDQPGIYYKAGFVPSALRVTLRMLDQEGLNPKTMQQSIWLRRKSR